MAVLWLNTAQIVVPSASSIHTIDDLRGRRVAVGVPGSGTEVLAKIILEAYHIRYSDIHPAFSSFRNMVTQIRHGGVDAAIIVTGVPAPAVQDMSGGSGIRLLSVDADRINAVRSRYPFLRPVTIPAHTYRHVADDVKTVGVNDLLICRKELDEGLVYRLTKAFFEALPALQRNDTAAGTIDLDEAPGAPIPLHPGAARYYREREIGR